MMCYEKSCRLCLKDLCGPGIDCCSINELRDAISTLFEVEIYRTDLSRSICNKCFESVMSFRAFKKTVCECQKIIKDYETIKKKVLECSVVASIKEEIIDLSSQDRVAPGGGGGGTKRKRAELASIVTDSQIENILDIVHDKGNKGSNSSKNSTAKRSKTTTTPNAVVKLEPITFTVNDTIEILDDDESNDTNTIINNGHNDDREENDDDENDNDDDNETEVAGGISNDPAPNEITSSTSRENLDKESPNRTDPSKNLEVRSDSLSSTSTSGIGSSQDLDKTIVKKEPNTDGCSNRMRKDATVSTAPNEIHTPGTVSSSVSTSADEQLAKNSNIDNTSPPATTHQPQAAPELESSRTQELQESVATDKAVDGQSSDPETDDLFKSPTFRLASEEPTEQPQTAAGGKSGQKSREDLSISSSVDDFQLYGRERSTRQAKSQALKKLATPPTNRRSGAAPNNFNSLGTPASNKPAAATSGKTTPHLSGGSNRTTPSPTKLPPPMTRSQHSPAIPPDDKSLALCENPALYQQASPPKKRVITITLLRTKDSVNFRYCDQFKQTIHFDSVTSEELEDIRSSLKIPEIWSNLKNVFKTSPPDDKTINELKTIFGQEFNI